jgi:hypothetical protein
VRSHRLILERIPLMKNVLIHRNIPTVVFLSCLLLTSLGYASSPLDGNLAVSNSRAHSVRVKIDGKHVGSVQAGTKRTFRSIPNGVRVVRIRGRGPGTIQRVTIPISATAALKIKARRGKAKIHNRSKFRVRIAIDGAYAGTLAPGASISSRRLRPGRHEVTASPVRFRDRGLKQNRQVMIRAGEQSQVSIGAFLAKVRVQNPYNRRVTLLVDGERFSRIAPLGEVHVADLRPGAHKFVLRKRGKILNRIDMRLQTGQLTAWNPTRMANGRVQIANQTRGPISVSVDGHQSDWVRPGEAITLSHIQPGVHSVSIVHRRGRLEERTVRVPRRGTARINVERRNRVRVSSRSHRARMVARR